MTVDGVTDDEIRRYAAAWELPGCLGVLHRLYQFIKFLGEKP